MKIDRLMGIVTLLLQKKEMTAGQLAETFEVSIRTVNRDIEILCQAGIPVVTRPGYRGGIGLAEGFTIDRRLLDKNELEALLIGVKGLGSVLEGTGQKLLKAKFFTEGTQADERMDSIVINLASHYQDSLSAKISLLQQAVKERKTVGFTYYYSKGEGRRNAEPYSLVFQWSSWYLLAWCMERKDFRMFKLNRLWEPEKLEQTFVPRKVPEGILDVDAPFSEEEWELEASFDPAVKYRLIEEYGPGCFEVETDGRLWVKLCFSNYGYLLQWILSFGASAKVVRPEKLRRDVAAQIQKMISFYEEYDR